MLCTRSETSPRYRRGTIPWVFRSIGDYSPECNGLIKFQLERGRTWQRDQSRGPPADFKSRPVISISRLSGLIERFPDRSSPLSNPSGEL